MTALSPPDLSRTTAPLQQAAMAHWHCKASRAPGTEVFPSVQEALVEKSRRPLHSEIKGEVSYWGRGGRREERGQRDGGGRAAIQKEAEICVNQSFCASCPVSYAAKSADWHSPRPGFQHHPYHGCPIARLSSTCYGSTLTHLVLNQTWSAATSFPTPLRHL